MPMIDANADDHEFSLQPLLATVDTVHFAKMFSSNLETILGSASIGDYGKISFAQSDHTKMTQVLQEAARDIPCRWKELTSGGKRFVQESALYGDLRDGPQFIRIMLAVWIQNVLETEFTLQLPNSNNVGSGEINGAPRRLVELLGTDNIVCLSMANSEKAGAITINRSLSKKEQGLLSDLLTAYENRLAKQSTQYSRMMPLEELDDTEFLAAAKAFATAALGTSIKGSDSMKSGYKFFSLTELMLRQIGCVTQTVLDYEGYMSKTYYTVVNDSKFIWPENFYEPEKNGTFKVLNVIKEVHLFILFMNLVKDLAINHQWDDNKILTTGKQHETGYAETAISEFVSTSNATTIEKIAEYNNEVKHFVKCYDNLSTWIEYKFAAYCYGMDDSTKLNEVDLSLMVMIYLAEKKKAAYITADYDSASVATDYVQFLSCKDLERDVVAGWLAQNKADGDYERKAFEVIKGAVQLWYINDPDRYRHNWLLSQSIEANSEPRIYRIEYCDRVRKANKVYVLAPVKSISTKSLTYLSREPIDVPAKYNNAVDVSTDIAGVFNTAGTSATPSSYDVAVTGVPENAIYQLKLILRVSSTTVRFHLDTRTSTMEGTLSRTCDYIKPPTRYVPTDVKSKLQIDNKIITTFGVNVPFINDGKKFRAVQMKTIDDQDIIHLLMAFNHSELGDSRSQENLMKKYADRLSLLGIKTDPIIETERFFSQGTSQVPRAKRRRPLPGRTLGRANKASDLDIYVSLPEGISEHDIESKRLPTIVKSPKESGVIYAFWPATTWTEVGLKTYQAGDKWTDGRASQLSSRAPIWEVVDTVVNVREYAADFVMDEATLLDIFKGLDAELSAKKKQKGNGLKSLRQLLAEKKISPDFDFLGIGSKPGTSEFRDGVINRISEYVTEKIVNSPTIKNDDAKLYLSEEFSRDLRLQISLSFSILDLLTLRFGVYDVTMPLDFLENVKNMKEAKSVDQYNQVIAARKESVQACLKEAGIDGLFGDHVATTDDEYYVGCITKHQFHMLKDDAVVEWTSPCEGRVDDSVFHRLQYGVAAIDNANTKDLGESRRWIPLSRAMYSNGKMLGFDSGFFADIEFFDEGKSAIENGMTLLQLELESGIAIYTDQFGTTINHYDDLVKTEVIKEHAATLRDYMLKNFPKNGKVQLVCSFVKDSLSFDDCCAKLQQFVDSKTVGSDFIAIRELYASTFSWNADSSRYYFNSKFRAVPLSDKLLMRDVLAGRLQRLPRPKAFKRIYPFYGLEEYVDIDTINATAQFFLELFNGRYSVVDGTVNVSEDYENALNPGAKDEYLALKKITSGLLNLNLSDDDLKNAVEKRMISEKDRLALVKLAIDKAKAMAGGASKLVDEATIEEAVKASLNKVDSMATGTTGSE